MTSAFPSAPGELQRGVPQVLELNDIQAGVLNPLPVPYVGRLAFVRIGSVSAGREFLKRLVPVLRPATDPFSSKASASITAAISFQGLRALGTPDSSLHSFAPEFCEGMAARAARLHDVGESAPEHWEAPFGSADVHIALSAAGPERDPLDALLRRAAGTYAEVGGVSEIYHHDFKSSDGFEAFGFRDNISQPAIEGSGIAGSDAGEPPIRAGEFILGYLDETDRVPSMPIPEILARNGSYLVIRKLQQRVDLFRRYLRATAASPDDEELLAAKIMGRWRSGAPLALAPERDDPALGADPHRNNNFAYGVEDDARGFKCPFGSHVRRTNPRDGEIFGSPRRHRLLRREASYGPPLAPGVLDDDGVERGMIFACIGASIKRQFEFVQEEWINSGIFIGQSEERDPLCGANDGTQAFTIPVRPIRRRVRGLPRFVVTRGGEYFFVPGLKALRWIADPPT
jgi:Dyp-type peroxidase family